MGAEAKNILEEGSSDLNPMVQEFLDRALHEDIVDLYVEYHNREVDLEYQPGDRKEEAKNLRLIVSQCEQRIVQKALQKSGYDSRLVLKYVKNKK